MATEKRLICAGRHERVLRRFAEHLMERGMVEGAEAVNTIIKGLMLEPTVDAVGAVHGRWKYYHKHNIAVCTNCSFERDLDANFGTAVSCPNCGAKMDGDGNG